MRILIVYNYVPSHQGGIEVVLDAHASEWARRGHEVTVVGSDVPGTSIRPPSNAYRVIGVPAGNWIEDRLGVPYPIPSPAMLRVLHREVANADVVHGHGFLCFPTLAAFSFARRLRDRSPVRLLTEHVAHVKYPSPLVDAVETVAIQSVGRACLALAEGIVAYNTRVSDELRVLVPEKPQRSIANGVDFEVISPATVDERARLRAEFGWDEVPRVLFVGRLVPKKGADIAAKAGALGNGAFKLIMIGEGRLPESSSPHVEFVGAVPYDRLAKLYRAADAFLLPSHGEGFPLTVQEALASGLPVFLGEDDSFRAHSRDIGESIHLVRRDPGAIVKALLDFLSTSDRQASARQSAVDYARRSFSWKHAIDEHAAFVDELRTRRSSKAR